MLPENGHTWREQALAAEAERDRLRDALAQQRKFCPECGAPIFPHVPAEPYRPGSEGEGG